MAQPVSAADVQKNFGHYRDRARDEPVVVTESGRPSVVILSAGEYERLKRLDRQVLAVTELGDDDIAAIGAARIPAANRYRSDDLP